MTLLISPLQGEATVVSNPPALAPQVLRFQAQDTSDLHLTSFVWFRLFFFYLFSPPLPAFALLEIKVSAVCTLREYSATSYT